MSKSVISNERKCLVCGTMFNLHKHHIFNGMSFRKPSETHGCWCYLCGRHHNLSSEGVHFNKDLDLRLKRHAQRKLEASGWTREQFMDTFGRNYIDD
jgi:hypothetical protein